SEDWISARPETSGGNSVTIPFAIEVPPRSGETLRASVTIQGNGRQQFVVPVTLTVESAAAPAEEDEPQEQGRRLRLSWVLAGRAGLVLLVCVGVLALVMSRRSRPPVDPPVVTQIDPPPRVVEAWWDGIPNNKLTESVAKLKEAAPAEQALIDAVAVKED